MALKFNVVLPAPPADPADWAEIASGQLTVQIDADPVILIQTDKSLQETEPRHVTDERFVGQQGAHVTLTFAYIDDAGNVGASVGASEVLVDSVPPVAPDMIGLVEVAEVA